MKVAYTTITDSYNIRAWSGLNVNIFHALANTGLNIQAIGNLKAETPLSFIKGAYYGRIKKQTFFKVHDTGVLRGFARQVAHRLKAIDCDIIFSPKWEPIAYLQTDKPLAFWHDATVPSLVGFYPGYDNACQESISNAIKAEGLALEKCNLAIYSSEWAAQSAVDYYGIDPGKVAVVPFGANLVCSRTPEDILASAEQRGRDRCRLLFIGGEWDRKGGGLAVQVAQELNRRGITSELHVAGCRPTGLLPDCVRVHGFIYMNTEEGNQKLENLFSQSHFLIVPSRAEAFGVVFAEASAFGLPSLATNVGGIPSVIHDGVNGQTFPLSASWADYADVIEKLWHDRGAYKALCQSSFQAYITRLNWETSGREVAASLREHCE